MLKYAKKISGKRCNLKDHDTRSLRSNRKLLLKETKCNNVKYEKSFKVAAIKYWNKLPEEIKRIRNIKQFATRVKQELLLEKINFPQ